MDPLDPTYRQLPLHHMHTDVVEVNELTKTYGSVVALNAVTLSVPNGSVYGLVGPHGAGKTTLSASSPGSDPPPRERSLSTRIG
jgi:ABC-type branched-subunit amino acid transport system ATPase component